MVAGTKFYIIFATICIGPIIADFKGSSMAKPPVLDIGDGTSISIKAYPCRYSWFWIWRYQLITIISEHSGEEKEVGWAKMKCANFDKTKRELCPGYINLGDAIFVNAVKDKPIMVIIKLKNKSCQQKVLTDDSWNPLEKVEVKVLTYKECTAEIKKIRPKKVHLGSSTMQVRLDPNTFSKALQSNMKHLPKQFAATGAAKGTTQQPKQSLQIPAMRSENQPQMTMLTLDSSDVDQYIAKWDEGVAWYLSNKLVMTYQNLYRGPTCIRVVTIAKAIPDDNEEDIKLAKFKVTCGNVEGLTAYPDLIKYQKAFVFVLNNDKEASGYYNLSPNNCLYRKYTLEGKEVKWTDENQDDEQCKSLMTDTTGSIFSKEYKDTEFGLTGDGMDFVYVSNNSSPKEEEEEQEKEEKEAEAGDKNTGGFFGRWFG